MGVEIERKFLLDPVAAADGSWRQDVVASSAIEQGYLCGGSGRAFARLFDGGEGLDAAALARECGVCASVRVRVEDDRANINIKSLSLSIARDEYEFPIDREDGLRMLATMCGPRRIVKRRHRVPVGAHVFEVDEFWGANQGLVVAEVELATVDEAFVRPPWLGQEVSEDARFFNVALVERPFSTW